MKAFNFNSEKLDLSEATKILGGEWNGSYPYTQNQVNEDLQEKDQAQNLIKAHSLIINENVELRLMFQRLDVYCTGKRNVQINTKLNDDDLEKILKKIGQLSPNLNELAIKNCHIGKGAAEILAQILCYHQERSVQSLRVLKLVNCKIHGTQMV